ncbi:hypothetical protein PR048_022006 [Dryococelus australis]|uniref:Uncharacterized protein n=1 Tax=Dryococelus australis TaxID=614101 RepID=A0ABQ9H016_9NEOP|nr:hypothetical protein PR048_022006 [Dryococelus australis]
MKLRRNARAAKREIPEKTRRPAASSGTIPACENPGATPPRIESGSPQYKTTSVTTTSPRPPRESGDGDGARRLGSVFLVAQTVVDDVADSGKESPRAADGLTPRVSPRHKDSSTSPASLRSPVAKEVPSPRLNGAAVGTSARTRRLGVIESTSRRHTTTTTSSSDHEHRVLSRMSEVNRFIEPMYLAVSDDKLKNMLSFLEHTLMAAGLWSGECFLGVSPWRRHYLFVYLPIIEDDVQQKEDLPAE